MYMTVKEVLQKLQDVLKNTPNDHLNLLVTSALVVQEDDDEITGMFAPGTVLFNCVDTINDDYYQLYLNPDRVGKWKQ